LKLPADLRIERAITSVNKLESGISLKDFSLFLCEISSVVTRLCASWPVPGEQRNKAYEQQQHEHEASFVAHEGKRLVLLDVAKILWMSVRKSPNPNL